MRIESMRRMQLVGWLLALFSMKMGRFGRWLRWSRAISSHFSVPTVRATKCTVAVAAS